MFKILLLFSLAFGQQKLITITDSGGEIRSFQATSHGVAITQELDPKRHCLKSDNCFRCPKNSKLVFSFYRQTDIPRCVFNSGKIVSAVSVD